MTTVAEARCAGMRIGGFTPFTSIDYPGELAAVVYLQGCPWRCRYCHNTELLDIKEDSRVTWSDVQDMLRTRRGLLDAVVFSGGEPTSQHALFAAIRQVRELGFKVGLHTAGSHPQRLSGLLPFLDWVGLDIKALPQDYPALTGVKDSGAHAFKSLQLILDSGVSHEVRITVHQQLLAPTRLQQLIDLLSEYGVHKPVLQRCRDGMMLDASLGPNHLAWPESDRCSVEQWFSVFPAK